MSLLYVSLPHSPTFPSTREEEFPQPLPHCPGQLPLLAFLFLHPTGLPAPSTSGEDGLTAGRLQTPWDGREPPGMQRAQGQATLTSAQTVIVASPGLWPPFLLTLAPSFFSLCTITSLFSLCSQLFYSYFPALLVLQCFILQVFPLVSLSLFSGHSHLIAFLLPPRENRISGRKKEAGGKGTTWSSTEDGKQLLFSLVPSLGISKQTHLPTSAFPRPVFPGREATHYHKSDPCSHQEPWGGSSSPSETSQNDLCLLSILPVGTFSHRTHFSIPILIPRKSRAALAICSHSRPDATWSPGFFRKLFKQHPVSWPL